MNKLGRPRMTLPDSEISSRYLNGESESSLSVAFGVAVSTIHRRLVSYKVSLRNPVQAKALRTRRTFDSTQEFLGLLDGLVLGDAWIEVDGSSEGRLGIEQRGDRGSWFDLLTTEFEAFGVSSTKAPIKGRVGQINGKKFVGRDALSFRTGKYKPFTNQRERWYPLGKKRVPRDIRLDPKTLAHWYWGDGSTSKGRMAFHTDGFPEEDVRFLQGLLRANHAWTPTVQKRTSGQHILVLHRKEQRQELVSLIRPFCPSCFEYKLNTGE